MPRRYQTVCAEDRRRIIDAYIDGRDYVAVAHGPGVRRTTAWSVIAKWQRTGEATARPRGGNRPFKVDESRDLLLMLVEADPTITLQRQRSEGDLAGQAAGLRCHHQPCPTQQPDICEADAEHAAD